ncbi:hypothetical protein ACRAWF_02350 [Streptomyces sp. L7]
MRGLVALGDKYHVEIIPEINSPGRHGPVDREPPRPPAHRQRRQQAAAPGSTSPSRRRSTTTRA